MKPKLLVSVVHPLVVYAFVSCEVEKSIGIQYDTSSPLLTYGVDKLKKSFSEQVQCAFLVEPAPLSLYDQSQELSRSHSFQ